MGTVIVSLLPLIVGAALLPVWIIMALFLLRGEGGVLKAAAFAAGAMTVRVVQGVLFGFVFGAATDASGESGASLITSTLLLVLGILMLISAVRKWRKEEDPDAPPPKWMDNPRWIVGAQGVRHGRAVDGACDQTVGLYALGHRRHRAGGVEPGRQRAGLSLLRAGCAVVGAGADPRLRRWRPLSRPGCSTQSTAGWSATTGRSSSRLLRFSACGFFGWALPA